VARRRGKRRTAQPGPYAFVASPGTFWARSPGVTGRTRLFETAGFATGTEHRLYDVSPDGKRFVMLSLGQSKPSALVLVKNWLSKVEARPGG
jgi:hypothetical protein